MKPTKQQESKEPETHLRLRILKYHLQVIATLNDTNGATLHTVKGFNCPVQRTDNGGYLIGGAECKDLPQAIAHYFDLLSPHVTGLHSDKD